VLKQVDFYFEFSSAYSYLALPGVADLSEKHQVKVNWKPFLLGPIFQELNMLPMDLRTVKGKYVKRDIERRAVDMGLQYQWPQSFPYNSLKAARVFWSLAADSNHKAIDWARAVFHATFAEGGDGSDPVVLARVAATLGYEADSLLQSTNTDVVKQKLKAATSDAANRGVFGSPTFFVGSEMFWGSDRFADLIHFIDGAWQTEV